jgi:hypothetical protein
MAINEDKLNDFISRFVGDLGATVSAGNVVIGHHLGFYRTLAAGPLTPGELAAKTETDPRYVTEWLRGQAAGGYVEYDDDRYSLSEEQAFALADPDGPLYAPGAFLLALGALRAEPRITEAFRSGAGLGWDAHDADVFVGCEQFFRPGYIANLVPSWIPAPRSPTSAAGWARRRCCWRRRTRGRPCTPPTTTRARSTWPTSGRRMRGWRTG